MNFWGKYMEPKVEIYTVDVWEEDAEENTWT
jgi:hypothetical protein